MIKLLFFYTHDLFLRLHSGDAYYMFAFLAV